MARRSQLPDYQMIADMLRHYADAAVTLWPRSEILRQADMLAGPLPRTEDVKSTPIVFSADDALAEQAYTNYVNNHPTMHSNRFPTWRELDERSRDKWRVRVSRGVIDG